MTTENPLTYAIGDVVIVIDTGEKGPITNVSYGDDMVEYGCCGMAWRSHDKLRFVHRATKESLKKAFKQLKEE